MNLRNATLATVVLVGSSALGALGVRGAARGAGELLSGLEALAVGRAGRIAVESLGRQAANHARAIAFDATLGVVRGLSAVYAATQSRELGRPAVKTTCGRRVLHTWTQVEVDVRPRCEAAKGSQASS